MNEINTKSLREQVAAILAEDPNAKTLLIAQQLNVSEPEALAAYPPELCTELPGDSVKEIILRLEELGKVHVIVNSGSAISETFGEFGGFSEAGPFLNVSTRSLHMHIMIHKINRVFAVSKTFNEIEKCNCSFQFFDNQGHSAFKVFIHSRIPERTSPIEKDYQVWNTIISKFKN